MMFASNVHSVQFFPPGFVHVVDGLPPVPRVQIDVWFVAQHVAPSVRLRDKTQFGSSGRPLVSLVLVARLQLYPPLPLYTPGWGILSSAAFATSSAFADGIDAECKGCCDSAPRRWWADSGHAPLGSRLRELVTAGGTLLDLRRCHLVSPRIAEAPWRTAGVTQRSTEPLWALLAGGRHQALCVAIRRVCACSDLCKRISQFVLESTVYEFVADLHMACSVLYC